MHLISNHHTYNQAPITKQHMNLTFQVQQQQHGNMLDACLPGAFMCCSLKLLNSWRMASPGKFLRTSRLASVKALQATNGRVLDWMPSCCYPGFSRAGGRCPWIYRDFPNKLQGLQSECRPRLDWKVQLSSCREGARILLLLRQRYAHGRELALDCLALRYTSVCLDKQELQRADLKTL